MSSTYWDTSYPPGLWTAADLVSLLPNSVVVNTPTTVVITGTGFTSRSVVWADEESQTTEFISPTQLRYTALADAVGAQDITVRNAGSVSDSLSLTVTATAGVQQAAAQPASSPVDSPSSPQEAPEASQGTGTAQEAPEASQGTTESTGEPS